MNNEETKIIQPENTPCCWNCNISNLSKSIRCVDCECHPMQARNPNCYVGYNVAKILTKIEPLQTTNMPTMSTLEQIMYNKINELIKIINKN